MVYGGRIDIHCLPYFKSRLTAEFMPLLRLYEVAWYNHKMKTFDTLNISHKTKQALTALNYIEPTQVQESVISEMIAGHD